MKSKHFFIAVVGLLTIAASVKSIRDTFMFDIKTAYAGIKTAWVFRDGIETMVVLDQVNYVNTESPVDFSANAGVSVEYISGQAGVSVSDLNNCIVITNYCKPKNNGFCFLDDTGVYVVNANGNVIQI